MSFPRARVCLFACVTLPPRLALCTPLKTKCVRMNNIFSITIVVGARRRTGVRRRAEAQSSPPKTDEQSNSKQFTHRENKYEEPCLPMHTPKAGRLWKIRSLDYRSGKHSLCIVATCEKRNLLCYRMVPRRLTMC